MIAADSATVLALIAADREKMAILRAVRELQLPDWAIGAGFVRNPVWDEISGKTGPTRPSDTDVLYYDPADLSPKTETKLEACLRAALPDAPRWSVTNQARMHRENGDPPYASTEEALRWWLETPTAVAVRLERDGSLRLLAPHGLDDLFGLIVRPTPRGREQIDVYRRRMAEKNWVTIWPTLRIET